MELREPLDGAQVALLGQERADQAVAQPRGPTTETRGGATATEPLLLDELHQHALSAVRVRASSRPHDGPMGRNRSGEVPVRHSRGTRETQGSCQDATDRPLFYGRAKGVAASSLRKTEGSHVRERLRVLEIWA